MDAMVGLGVIVGGFAGAAIGARMANAEIWKALLLTINGFAGGILLLYFVPEPNLFMSFFFYYAPFAVAGIALGLAGKQIAYVAVGNFVVGSALAFLLSRPYLV
jgi:hypothetical protein